MEPDVTPTQEQRRAGLFRPIAMLVVGAVMLLLLNSLLLFYEIAQGGKRYERNVVEQSWHLTLDGYQQAFASLTAPSDTPLRLMAGNKGWIEQQLAAPMRAISGSGNVVVRPANPATPLGWRIEPGAEQPNIVLVAPAGKAASMARAEAVIAIDTALARRFATQHHLNQAFISEPDAKPRHAQRLPLTDRSGHVMAMLEWSPADPVGDLRARMPFILLGFASVFGLVVWFFMRQSTHAASDLIASEARARHLAFHDMLTGLANRAMMFDRLRQMLAMSRRYYGELAVHCLDLDRFKEVNDTLGHHAGDELIQQVARRLTDLCRDSDTVARLGGDEFVILQPETNAAGASHLAERVLKLFETPFQLEAGTVEVGVSIGVTLITNPELEAAEVLRQADMALYGSKEGGRNRVTFFEPDMDAALRMRRSLESDLRQALAEGGLTMVYQPQVDARGQIEAMEALVRWNHPEKGPIGPSIFVPLCEESGLILDLGEYIFRRVFEETGSWINTRVAINVSALQLRSPMFMGTLTRLVAEFHVDPSRYEIEITETALLGDDGTTRDNIIMLKQEGFSIALDDFGTGYSSLSLLKRFAVDKIKIDRSFVHNLEASDEAEGLVDAIVRLGKALKLGIVAEGVETQHQRDRLAACGCNNFQGFLMSRPAPASELTGLHLG